MKTYYVTFDFGSYICEHTYVYADSKRQVKAIIKRQYGNDARIRTIEEEQA